MGLNPLSFLIKRNKKVKRIKRIVFLIIIILIIIMTFAGTVYILNILELADIADSDSDGTVYQGDDNSGSSSNSDSNSSTSTGVQKRLESADKLDKYMADNGYSYYYDDENQNNNVYDITYNVDNYKRTCCSTYVSWCLQDAGLMSSHVDGAMGITNNLSSDPKWTKVVISDEADMKKGDNGIYAN